MPMMPRFYEVNLKPTLSRISQTSLRALTSSGRSKTSHIGSAKFAESTPSTIKPLSNVVVTGARSDTQVSHDYIELRDPSTTSTIYHDPKAM
jgi:hypothetical protein